MYMLIFYIFGGSRYLQKKNIRLQPQNGQRTAIQDLALSRNQRRIFWGWDLMESNQMEGLKDVGMIKQPWKVGDVPGSPHEFHAYTGYTMMVMFVQERHLPASHGQRMLPEVQIKPSPTERGFDPTAHPSAKEHKMLSLNLGSSCLTKSL